MEQQTVLWRSIRAHTHTHTHRRVLRGRAAKAGNTMRKIAVCEFHCEHICFCVHNMCVRVCQLWCVGVQQLNTIMPGGVAVAKGMQDMHGAELLCVNKRAQDRKRVKRVYTCPCTCPLPCVGKQTHTVQECWVAMERIGTRNCYVWTNAWIKEVRWVYGEKSNFCIGWPYGKGWISAKQFLHCVTSVYNKKQFGWPNDKRWTHKSANALVRTASVCTRCLNKEFSSMFFALKKDHIVSIRASRNSSKYKAGGMSICCTASLESKGHRLKSLLYVKIEPGSFAHFNPTAQCIQSVKVSHI